MKKLIYFIFITIALLLFSCTTEPVITNHSFTSYQVPGCNRHTLSKSTNPDSCFVYSFEDTLKIDFCVTGNCCPDSNRFTTNYKIKSDTIFVKVKDIEEHICRCMCNYTIHLEFNNLEKDKYIFYCDYDNLKYREYVRK